MKRTVVLSIALTALFTSTLFACIDERSKYSAGVLFNNNEQIHFEKLESLGTEGINYNKDCLTAKPDDVREIIVLSATDPVAMSHDIADIKEIAIRGDICELTVSYSGGCKTHEFALFAEKTTSEPNPSVLSLTLSHNANEDACKSIITETLVFSLDNLKNSVSDRTPVLLSIKMPSGDFAAVISKKSILWYQGNNCSYQYYRTESSSSVYYCVSLEYMTHEYTGEEFPCLRILQNPDIVTAVAVNLGSIAKNELEWLMNKGIISSLDINILNNINKKIGTDNTQYWTSQDSAISYGGFFEYTIDNNGKYLWTDSVLYSRVDKCSGEYNFNPTPEPIDTDPTHLTSGYSRKQKEQRGFSLTADSHTCKVSLDKPSAHGATFSILDFKGRTISKHTLAAAQKSFTISMGKSLANGIYRAIYQENGKILKNSNIIIH